MQEWKIQELKHKESLKTSSLYSLVVLSFFRGRVCNAYNYYSCMLVYCMMTACVISTFICVRMPHFNAISHRDT